MVITRNNNANPGFFIVIGHYPGAPAAVTGLQPFYKQCHTLKQ